MATIFDSPEEVGNHLPLRSKLVFEAVKKRSGDPVSILQYTDGSLIKHLILSVRLLEVAAASVDVYVPQNDPATASSVSWSAVDFSQQISTLTDMTGIIFDALRLATPDRQKVKINFQLVFLDADCRPMFVSASSGLIAASDFDVAMFSRREGDQQQPLPSCRRNDRSESPLGWPIDPPDSDADDPWG